MSKNNFKTTLDIISTGISHLHANSASNIENKYPIIMLTNFAYLHSKPNSHVSVRIKKPVKRYYYETDYNTWRVQTYVPFESFSQAQLKHLATELYNIPAREYSDLYLSAFKLYARQSLEYVMFHLPTFELPDDDEYLVDKRAMCDIRILPLVYLVQTEPTKDNIDFAIDFFIKNDMPWKAIRQALIRMPAIWSNITTEQLYRLPISPKRIVSILYELIYTLEDDITLPAHFNDFFTKGMVVSALKSDRVNSSVKRQVKILRKHVCG